VISASRPLPRLARARQEAPRAPARRWRPQARRPAAPPPGSSTKPPRAARRSARRAAGRRNLRKQHAHSRGLDQRHRGLADQLQREDHHASPSANLPDLAGAFVLLREVDDDSATISSGASQVRSARRPAPSARCRRRHRASRPARPRSDQSLRHEGRGEQRRARRALQQAVTATPATKPVARLPTLRRRTWRRLAPYTRSTPVRTMCVPQTSSAMAANSSGGSASGLPRSAPRIRYQGSE